MKKYLALLVLVLTTTLSFGQSNYQDVVYLKNGSFIRGVIIEQVPNKSIKIETADRSVFVYQMDEIEMLSKVQMQSWSSSPLTSSGLQKGYRVIYELGYGIGTGYSDMNSLKLNIISGYQINSYFFIGLGVGVRCYIDEAFTLMPVFADFRANFIANDVSPYLALGVGYNFYPEWEGFLGEGFLINPTAGVSFMVFDKSVINVGIGFEMQRMQTWYDDWFYSGAIGMNVGISF